VRIFFLLLLWPFWAEDARAQTRTPLHLPTRVFTADDGLGGATITSLLKDARGFLWLGTPDDLTIYDGTRFAPFRYTDSSGAHQPFRRAALFSLGTYGVLIVHEEGAHQFALPAGRLRSLSGALPTHPVSTDATLHADPTSPGVFVLDARSFRAELDARSGRWTDVFHYPETDLPAIGVGVGSRAILACDTGASAREVYIHAREAAHNFHERHSLPFRAAFALMLAGNGTLFLDAIDAQALWWKPSGGTARVLLKLPTAANQLCAAAVGDAYYIAAGQSLLRFTPHTGAVEVLANAAGDRFIRSGVISRILPDGRTLWLGTNTNGLIRVSLEGSRLRHLRTDSAVFNWAHAILPDLARGRIYVGSYAGTVVVFDTAGRFLENLTPTLLRASARSSAYINAIEPLPDGRLLIWGGHNAWAYNPATRAATNLLPSAEAQKRAHSIDPAAYQGRFGVLRTGPWEWWVTEKVGLTRWRILPPQEGRPMGMEIVQIIRFRPPVPEALCSHAGAWWCARAGRLYRFDASGVTDSFWYPLTAFATHLAADAQGRLWIATESGIAVWGAGRTERILTTDDGLPNNHVYAVLRDAVGRMWGSTNGGLFCVNPSDFSVRAFTGGDGLQGAEFNLGAHARDARGRLYFGGMAGVNIVDPAAALRADECAPVTIVRVAGPDTIYHTYPGPTYLPALRLPHDRASLTLSFSAPGSDAAGPQRFEYRLREEDSVWTDNGTRRELQLFLSPGSYHVQVRVRGQPATAAGFVVEVAPPFYRAWWFIALAVLVGGAVAVLSIQRAARRRYEQRLLALETARHIQEEKERISRELHDELGARAALLSHNAALLREDSDSQPALSPILTRITDTTADMLTALRETVWTLKQEHLTAQSLWLRYKNFLAKAADTYSHIRFAVEEETPLPVAPLHYAQALHLLRILQEAVTNAVKHSGAATITASVRLRDSGVCFSVHDDGKGFDVAAAQAAGEGNGLHNMHHRSAEGDIQLHIQSKTGAGTVVEVCI